MKQVTEEIATTETRDAFLKMVKDLLADLSLKDKQTIDITTNDPKLIEILSNSFDDSMLPKNVERLDVTKGEGNVIKVGGQRIDFNPANLYPPIYEHDGKKYFGQPKRFATYWG